MSGLATLRALEPVIVSIGSHPGIIQSMLDYDYAIGRPAPSLVAIIAGGHKQERYFWGEEEVVIPVYSDLSALPQAVRKQANCLINVQSARRVLSSTAQALQALPNLKLATIFAEQVPEMHALRLADLAQASDVTLVGPASVGVLLPGVLKLGAIGGTMHPQFAAAHIFECGDTAVVSTSGGMVNELIHIVTGAGRRVSFAAALGGDRFPIATPAQVFLLAQADKQTKQIVYFGELGGDDEYVLADLIVQGKVTKPVYAYVAGTVAELFTTPPQFGHAKAMAASKSETASAKKQALQAVGVTVLDSLADLGPTLARQKQGTFVSPETRPIGPRRRRLIASRISGDVAGDVQLLGDDLLTTVEQHSFGGLVLAMLLGRPINAPKTERFVDYVLRLLVDHGPYVSGAVNTIVAARAGKDLVSSLAAGLLTIGPRFGGAINEAANGWLYGVGQGLSAKDFVESRKASGGIVAGIGHKKYRLDLPDPRVARLIQQFAGNSNGDRYLAFARQVEAVTTTKKSNLILNVDGAIAGLLLDLLESEAGYTAAELQELVDIDFFNALFVLSRSVGFSAHYLDQRRNDEGLFRLGNDDVTYIA